MYPTSGRARRENIGERPNDPSIENRYALRCEILPRAGAELDSCIQEPFKVAHSTSGKVVQNHDCPGLCTALRKRAIDPSIRFLPVDASMSAMAEGEVYAPAGRASGGEKLAGIRSPAEAGPKGEGFRGKF